MPLLRCLVDSDNFAGGSRRLQCGSVRNKTKTSLKYKVAIQYGYHACLGKTCQQNGTNERLLWLTKYLYDLSASLLRSTRQRKSGMVSNGARGHHDHGHGWPRWPRMGGVPYQALTLLRFFAYNIRACEKVRKGEGEPGNEANRIPSEVKGTTKGLRVS